MNNTETKQRRKWTPDTIMACALEFQYRGEFINKFPSAYNAAKKLGILDKIFEHMEWKGSRFFRHLYICTFSDGSVYIGLSYDPRLRFKQHLNDKRLIIYKKSKELNEIPTLKILTDKPLPKGDAAEMERKLIREYVDRGIHVLNDTTRPAGQLGAGDIIYTEEYLREYASRFKTRRELQIENVNIYSIIIQRKLYHLFDHMEWRGNTKYDIEDIKNRVNKYKRIKDLKENDINVYRYLCQNNLLKELTSHMIRLRDDKKYTYEELKEVALKYNKIKDFMNNDHKMFRKSYRHPRYDDIVSHIPGRTGKPRVIKIVETPKIYMRYTDDLIEKIIRENNIKTAYGKEGLRKFNLSLFRNLKRTNRLKDYFPDVNE